MAQAAVARHRLETVEARNYSLRRAATLRRRSGSGGANRRQPARPMAAREQSRADNRHANDVLPISRPSLRRGPATRFIYPTAGYGPVCPVVWEGCSRETAPYPDSPWTATARAFGLP